MELEVHVHVLRAGVQGERVETVCVVRFLILSFSASRFFSPSVLFSVRTPVSLYEYIILLCVNARDRLLPQLTGFNHTPSGSWVRRGRFASPQKVAHTRIHGGVSTALVTVNSTRLHRVDTWECLKSVCTDSFHAYSFA